MPHWQVISDKAGHYGLYVLMAMLLITGILSATFTAEPVIVFGLLKLSSEDQNGEMFSLIRGIHEFSTNAIIFLIIVHIVAALYHHFIVKDHTTINMMKFWTSKAKN